MRACATCHTSMSRAKQSQDESPGGRPFLGVALGIAWPCVAFVRAVSSSSPVPALHIAQFPFQLSAATSLRVCVCVCVCVIVHGCSPRHRV